MDTHTERRLTKDQTPGHQPPRARVVLGVGIGLYLLVLGGLGGTLVERIRFDHRRDAVLARYHALLGARNAGLMAIERDIAQRSGPADAADLGSVPFRVRAAAADNHAVGN